jgi:hypothetical protein
VDALSHGHDHGGGGHSGGHDDAHGHGAAPAHDPSQHGPAEIPPEPAQRSITPAPEDFRNLPGATSLAWPVLWMALAALLIGTLLCGGWPAYHDEHAEGGPEAGTHK